MLPTLLDLIHAPDGSVGREAQHCLDQLTKPPGSLGRLEELACRLAEITGKCPPAVSCPVIFTLAGDHGVVEEGSVQRQFHLPGQKAEITTWRHG